MLRRLARLVGIAVLATALVAPTRIAAAAAADDPPARVGRLSLIEGSASMRGPGDAQWSAATLNYPVTGGSAFATAPGKRAEIQIGSAAVRLDGDTELEFVRLDDEATRFLLARGTVDVRLRAVPPGSEFAIETANGRVGLLQPGSYRVEAAADGGRTRIAVLEGEARIDSARVHVVAPAGEAVEFGGDPVSFATSPATRTEFDDWAAWRERRERESQTARYVSPETTGRQDLDAAGSWRQTPEYGAVWYPTAVPVDWAPYRYGNWAWVAPWGWTWIDDAPWGFAPFHYGRWVHVIGAWGWVPGTVVARPCYAPALVAFVGARPGHPRAAGRHGSTIGWVPLAPRERYVPPYAASARHLHGVNAAHVDRRAEAQGTARGDAGHRPVEPLANRHAATLVPVDAMRHAEPIAPAHARHAGAADSLPVTRDLQGAPAPAPGPRVPGRAPGHERAAPAMTAPHIGAPAPVARPPGQAASAPERARTSPAPTAPHPASRSAAPAAAGGGRVTVVPRVSTPPVVETPRASRDAATATGPSPRSAPVSRAALPHRVEPVRVAPPPERPRHPVEREAPSMPRGAPPSQPQHAAPTPQRAAPQPQHAAPQRQPAPAQHGGGRGRCAQGTC